MFYKPSFPLAFSAIVLLILGCTVRSPIDAFPKDLVIQTFKANGELESEVILDSSGAVYKNLKTLLDSKAIQWTPSFVSYVTGRYVLRGDGLKRPGF